MTTSLGKLGCVGRITLRQARTFLLVAEVGSVTRAAGRLNRSQTSVTKALQDMESNLRVPLFDRSSKGVAPTAFGAALRPWLQQAQDAFLIAGELVPPITMRSASGATRFFHMDVSDKWLDAFVATADHQTTHAAASYLGVTPAAVSSSLRKLEDSIGVTLFERTAHGLAPTATARSLLRYVKLARSHLRHAVDEVDTVRGVTQGHIMVGTLPFIRSVILPRAITRVLDSHPQLDIATTEAPYPDLVAGLRCGDVDFIVGALRGVGNEDDIREETLLEDELSIIVRKGHPLETGRSLDWQALLAFPWVLPRHGTPTRELFCRLLKKRGHREPAHVVETSSMVTLRGLLLESDRLTVLSRQQVSLEERYGMLAALPIRLPETRRPIGITRRAHGTMAPAAELLASEIRAAARDLSRHPAVVRVPARLATVR